MTVYCPVCGKPRRWFHRIGINEPWFDPFFRKARGYVPEVTATHWRCTETAIEERADAKRRREHLIAHRKALARDFGRPPQ